MCAEGWREHTAEKDLLVDRAHLGRVHHDWYDVLYRRVMMLTSREEEQEPGEKCKHLKSLALLVA